MSSLIKAGSDRHAATGFAGFSLRDISRDAEAYLSEARARGEQIIADAQVQAAQEKASIVEQARRQGHAEGMAAGRKAGHEAALAEATSRFANDQKHLVDAMTLMISQFEGRRERFLAQSRQDVVLLAVAIARRLYGKLAGMESIAADVATESVDAALAYVRSATDVLIRIHPSDAGAVETFVDMQSGRTLAGKHVRILEDDTLDRGGIVVETADTTVDADITSRIDQIASELAAQWRERSKELSLES